ncbi:hypothetical protein ACKWTF_003165 [Chironomus riparius]
MGKTCKIASCNKNKTVTNLFKVPKNSLNNDKWLLFLKSNNISVDRSEISAVSDCNTFKTKFSDIVLSQVEIPFEHCSKTIENLILFFVTFRSKLELHCRLLHSKNKFASKN